MNWNDHSKVKGEHAFLSPSKFHWLNYDDERLLTTFTNSLAVQRGTELHDFACRSIKLGIRLPKTKDTLNMYVNDAIGYHLNPEQPLFYSYNCFGTADAIGYFEKKKLLRIHDLKTGSIPAHMEQLEIYAALFFLEYGYEPENTSMELRIYQDNECLIHEPDPKDICSIMDRIVRFDEMIENYKKET